MDTASKHKRQKSREQANEIRIQVQRRKKMTTLEYSTEVGVSNARNIIAAILSNNNYRDITQTDT